MFSRYLLFQIFSFSGTVKFLSAKTHALRRIEKQAVNLGANTSLSSAFIQMCNEDSSKSAYSITMSCREVLMKPEFRSKIIRNKNDHGVVRANCKKIVGVQIANHLEHSRVGVIEQDVRMTLFK